MSLILEALKKSEAKRRLGEAPDLGTPFATPQRRGRALPLLVLAIVAAGACGWWLLRRPAPPATPALAPANVSTTPTPAQPPPVAVAVAAPKTNPVPAPQRPRADLPSSAPTIVPTHAAPPQVVSAGALAAQRAAAAAPAISARQQGRARGAMAARNLPPDMHRVEKPVASEAAPAQASATPAAAPPDASAAVRSAPADSGNAPQLAKAQKTPEMRGLAPPAEAPASSTPLAAPSVPSPDTGAAPAQAQAKSDVQFYYELPFSVRKALPQLRLSMHVYAGDPAQRFVVLNDSRLAEGDKTADDVTLREVRKDGAVLEFQGQRFFYPRDGY